MPLLRRRGRALDGVAGMVRVDRRTSNLVRRLQPGDIALIDHLDLDRVSAEALVCCGVAAVLNVQPSISGRYPNLGPEIVVGAGIPLVDALGPDLVAQLSEGDPIRLDDAGVVYRGQTALGAGTVQTRDSVAAAMEGARSGLATQLEAFAANTVEYLRRERALLLDGVGVPAIRTDLDGRHVVVVVRGYDYREDLASLRPYIREYKPVLVGVDGGADALAHAGYRPDLIVGDMDSVTDRTLRCGAELVVRAYRDGTAPGQGRLERLGFTPVVFRLPGTARTSRCCSPTQPGRASSWPSVGTRPSWSTWTGTAPAWRAPSSPGCGSAESWSTRKPSAACPAARSAAGRSRCWRWSARPRPRPRSPSRLRPPRRRPV